MPRLKQMPLADIHENGRRYYEAIFDGRDPVKEPGTRSGSVGNWWTTIALRPYIFDHAADHMSMYGLLADEDNPSPSLLDPQIRELGVTLAGYLVGSKFVFSQHCKASRAVGLSDEQIEAIPNWGVSDIWTAKERAVLAFSNAVVATNGRVPDGVFEELQKHLEDEDIMELTYHITGYMMHAIFMRSLRLEFDDVPERVVEVPAPEGTDFTKWINQNTDFNE